jgi:hypothetical protein
MTYGELAMVDFADLAKIDQKILAVVETLLEVRASAHEFIKDPSNEKGEEMVKAVSSIDLKTESLKLNLGVMVKRASGIMDEVLTKEAENGIELE